MIRHVLIIYFCCVFSPIWIGTALAKTPSTSDHTFSSQSDAPTGDSYMYYWVYPTIAASSLYYALYSAIGRPSPGDLQAGFPFSDIAYAGTAFKISLYSVLFIGSKNIITSFDTKSQNL